MRVVVRVDGSYSLGTGHVMRCLTLADGLRRSGAAVEFVCREDEGHLADLIAERGFPAQRLSGPAADAHWTQDAGATIAAIEASPSGTAPNWLIVDHYALDQRWERAMRAAVHRVMVVDDLADREHDCELLLDQNLVAEIETRYAGKVPASCGMLLGPDYALLPPPYIEARDRVPAREGPVRRILVSFGGSGGHNLTERAVVAFLRLQRPDVELDVVLSQSGWEGDALQRLAAGHANIHLHRGLPTLVQLMVRADLAIGAGGATAWERLCLGLPAIVVTLADNQRPVAERLHADRLARWLGHYDAVDEDAIEGALRPLVEEGLDKDWSMRCRAAVDGKGLARVCAALSVTADTPLHARLARPTDEALLLSWANDPTTRRNGFSPEPITTVVHGDWFRTRLHSVDDCHFYIVETEDGVPVGQVRFDREAASWEIHYALAPVFRGRRLGRPLLIAALSALGQDEKSVEIIGRVKPENEPSRKIFESLGFELRRHAGADGVLMYARTN